MKITNFLRQTGAVTLFMVTLSVGPLVGGSSLRAEELSEKQVALTELKTAMELIESIEPYLERSGRALLFLLRKRTQSVLTSIQEKGYGNYATFNAYLKMVVTYQHSESIRKEIPQIAQENFKKLYKVVSTIAEKKGIEENEGRTHVTETVYAQIKGLIDQLLEQSLSETLQEKLEDLIPLLGRVQALAKEGDTPRVYARGKEAYEQIAKVYEEFNEVYTASPADALILEMMGLNEYYAKFAKDFEGVTSESQE